MIPGRAAEASPRLRRPPPCPVRHRRRRGEPLVSAPTAPTEDRAPSAPPPRDEDVPRPSAQAGTPVGDSAPPQPDRVDVHHPRRSPHRAGQLLADDPGAVPVAADGTRDPAELGRAAVVELPAAVPGRDVPADDEHDVHLPDHPGADHARARDGAGEPAQRAVAEVQGILADGDLPAVRGRPRVVLAGVPADLRDGRPRQRPAHRVRDCSTIPSTGSARRAPPGW